MFVDKTPPRWLIPPLLIKISIWPKIDNAFDACFGNVSMSERSNGKTTGGYVGDV